jgi:hypothetical protein
LASFAENARIKNFEHVYIIGSYDFKKTVSTQQKRAAILALAVSKSVERSSSVAVIGGGFAGITACATLLKLGHKVALFEQRGTLLPLQRRCHDRFIHPDLYDWPMSEGLDELCLAGLKWHADFADNVCQQIIESFDKVKQDAADRFAPVVATTVSRVEEDLSGKRATYTVFDAKEFPHVKFGAVLFAVGFGVERKVPFGSRVNGYWDNSTLNYCKRTKENPSRILVSGNGDGGLISVLDCTLKDFHQGRLLHDFRQVLTDDVRETIVSVEKEIRRDAHRGAVYNILRSYDEAFGKRFESWRPRIAHLISDETLVKFNGSKTGVFTARSSALNRFLVYLLIRCGFVGLNREPLLDTMVDEVMENDQLRFRVRWTSGAVEEFDFLIVRYGVNADFFSNAFPTLSDMLAGQKDFFPALQLVDAVPENVVKYLMQL